MATWRLFAAMSETDLSRTLKRLHFSAKKKRRQCTKSLIGAPRISKMGRVEDLTVAGKRKRVTIIIIFIFF